MLDLCILYFVQEKGVKKKSSLNELTFAVLPSSSSPSSQVAAVASEHHIKTENVWTMDEKLFLLGLSKKRTLVMWDDETRRLKKRRTPTQIQGESSFLPSPFPLSTSSAFILLRRL